MANPRSLAYGVGENMFPSFDRTTKFNTPIIYRRCIYYI